ncbi:MAG: hypothetical protein Q9221_005363 [Calogaya cf. arnoldii]
MDSYRPSPRFQAHDLPPPPPPPEMPPLAQRISPPRLPQASYHGGDSWRHHESNSNNSSRANFTFRNDLSAPQYPQDSNRYPRSNDRAVRRQKPRPRGYMSNQPGRGARWATAARPLLSSNRGKSPDPLLSGDNAQAQVQRFMPAEDVSDSGEEDMDESDGNDEPATNQELQPTLEASLGGLKGGDFEPKPSEETVEPPTKRRATNAAKQLKQQPSLPTWSNPDPYTVLPPVDEAQRKRKDVVKIIRKARIAAENEETTENQVAANDDFISFGFGDDQVRKEKSRSSSPPESEDGHQAGVPGAPTGPRSFSHLNNLHGSDTNAAPGTFDSRLSASDLGPPPGLPDGSVKIRAIYPDQAEALGNRKRTHEDEIKGEAVKVSVKKGHKAKSSGSVLRAWQCSESIDPIPWIVEDHRSTANSGFRLHKEICDFYEFVKPQRHEQIIREDLLQRLQTIVGKQLPDCSVHCFGSFAAAMYLPNADMDLVVISRAFRTSGRRVAAQSTNQMRNFAGYLQEIGLAKAGSVEVIPSAKVPLVKFIDQMTGIRVDVSFENETGLVANDTFSTWKRQFPAMPILTTVIKQFLMMRGLNEVVNGGLGGFSVTCLVTSLLQNLPRVQSGEVIPEQHLGEMLLEFLDLYGNQFDLDRTGISMKPPGYYDKQAAMRHNYRKDVYRTNNQPPKLAILDPNRPENDISGGSKNVGRIFHSFSEAHNETMEAMKTNAYSLLGWALGGNYENFTIQRERLRGLYEARWGSSELVAPQTISSQRSDIVTIAMNDITHGDSALHGALQASVFLNPLDPNVTVEPMVKRKGKKAQKNMARKKATSGSGMSNPQPDQEVTESVLKGARRAALLREKFPSMAGQIGDTISNPARKRLMNRFTAAKLIPQTRKKPDGVSTRQSMSGKVDKELGPSSKRKRSKKPKAPPVPGSTSNVPISIG